MSLFRRPALSAFVCSQCHGEHFVRRHIATLCQVQDNPLGALYVQNERFYWECLDCAARYNIQTGTREE